MFVTNWISTTKIQKISEITNFFRHYFLSRTEVASAIFYSGDQKEYTPFSLKLIYHKEYDATKKYKFAVIFSASKDGAAYEAAVGSKLLVDNVSIICE